MTCIAICTLTSDVRMVGNEDEPLAKFSVSFERYDDAQQKTVVDFYNNVTAKRAWAKWAESNLRKGKVIYLHARMKKFKSTKQDGSSYHDVELVVQTIGFPPKEKLGGAG